MVNQICHQVNFIYSRSFVAKNLYFFRLRIFVPLCLRGNNYFLCLLCFFVAIFFLFFPAVITHFHLRKSAKSADKKSVLIRHIRPPAAGPRAINLPFFCDSTFAQNRSFMMDFNRKPLKSDRFAKTFFFILP